MYFYRGIQKGTKVVTGPYLLGKNAMIHLNENAKPSLMLSSDESALIESTTEELGVYDECNLNPGEVFRARKNISNLEYRAIFAKFTDSGYSLRDWTEAMGINQNVHRNLLLGRTSLDILQSRQLADMCVSHTYIREVTAVFLCSQRINQRFIAEFQSHEFGQASLKILHMLKDAKGVAIQYYWRQRTHMDVCGLFPIIKKIVKYPARAHQLLADNFRETAEWASLVAESLSEHNSAGVKIDKNEQANVLEYLKLVNISTKLTAEEHKRMTELAISVAAIVINKQHDPKYANIEEAVMALIDAGNFIDISRMNLIESLKDYDNMDFSGFEISDEDLNLHGDFNFL